MRNEFNYSECKSLVRQICGESRRALKNKGLDISQMANDQLNETKELDEAVALNQDEERAAKEIGVDFDEVEKAVAVEEEEVVEEEVDEEEVEEEEVDEEVPTYQLGNDSTLDALRMEESF